MFNAALDDSRWLQSIPAVLDCNFEEFIRSSRKVNSPQRPFIIDGIVQASAWIHLDVTDRIVPPMGIVYTVPDGRAFFTPIGEATGKLGVNEARELLAPHPDLFVGKIGNKQPCEKLGPEGALATPEIQNWLLRAYNGELTPAETKKLSLG
jgi:hypothetical protein